MKLQIELNVIWLSANVVISGLQANQFLKVLA